VNRRKRSGGFSLVEFFLGCVILAIIAMGLTSTLSYFSKSGTRFSADTKVAALSELLRSEIIDKTRGSSWYDMSSVETAASKVDSTGKELFPKLVYDRTVFDIQNNARRVTTIIYRKDDQGQLEIMKKDEYSVSPRPGSSHGARIRVRAHKDSINGPPADKITANAPPVEGTINGQCVNTNNVLGTGTDGECVIYGVKVDPNPNVVVTVQTTGSLYFFSAAPYGAQTFNEATAEGTETVVDVIVSKRNRIIVKTYNRDGGNTNPANADPANGVRLFFEGRNLGPGCTMGDHEATTTTGFGGNLPGRYEDWVCPGAWRITVMGSDTRTGLDFESSSDLANAGPSGTANGFVPLPLNSADYVATYMLPKIGSATGNVYKFKFTAGSPGTFSSTTNPVGGVNVYYIQSDARALHGDVFTGDPLTDAVQPTTADPYIRYLNHTVGNQRRFGCTGLIPSPYCASWARAPGISSNDDGSYTASYVAPLIVNSDFGSDTSPEKSRVFTKYYPGSHVGNGATPIVLVKGMGQSRLNSQFYLGYGDTPAFSSYDVYPRTGSGTPWPLLKRIMASDGDAATYNVQNIYLLGFSASNFLRLVGDVLNPPAINGGVGIFQGNGAGTNPESKFTLQLTVPSLGATYPNASQVVSSGGIQHLVHPQPLNIAVGTNQSYSFDHVVPPLGDNGLVIYYQSGSFSSVAVNYVFQAKVLSNIHNAGGGYTHDFLPSANVTFDVATSLAALSPLGTNWVTFTSPTLNINAGAATLASTRQQSDVYAKYLYISNTSDLDPTGAPLQKNIQLDNNDHVSGTPPHCILVLGTDASRYRAIQYDPISNSESISNFYGLTFTTPPDQYSATLYFVEQRHLRFVGNVYDTGNINHDLPNPAVTIQITYKQPVGMADSVITVTSSDTGTPLGGCQLPPCPANAQYDVEAWVPMTNNAWHYKIDITDASHRYYDVHSTPVPVDNNTAETPSFQRFDAPLEQIPTPGG
jgi:hypothetical protein